MHLFQEYRETRKLYRSNYNDAFDLEHGVDTGGKYGGRVYLSDLKIDSPNWGEGKDYGAAYPEQFNRALLELNIPFHEYTFIDFGSGKGRALLLASSFPFKKIIGLEFALELHQIAEQNILRYHSSDQICYNIQSLHIDFVDFLLPETPLILYFYNPCFKSVLQKALKNIEKNLLVNTSPVHIIYLSPGREQEKVLRSTQFLRMKFESTDWHFLIYDGVIDR